MSMCKRIGIPIEKVGERLRQLNEAIKANNMAVQANSKVEIEYGRDEKAVAVTISVYLLGEYEEK